MKKVILYFVVVAVTLSFFTMTGVAEEGMLSFGAKQFEPEGGLRFAFVSISTQVAFWVPVDKGIADFAAQYGVKAVHLGPPDYKPEEQVAVLENLLEIGIDGVSIFIPEPGLMDSVIAKYLDKGIPVIIQNTGSEDAKRLGIAYVGKENYLGGLEWGKKIVEVLGGSEEAKGKQVLFMTEAPGQSSLEKRLKGAKKILDEVGVIYKTIDVTTDREKAYSNIESAYTANPEIVGLFSTDTTGTPTAGLFVKNNNLVGKVVVGGFDLTPDTLVGIKGGYIEFTIDQYPYRAGHLAMTMLYEKIVLGLEPFDHFIPSGFIDKSNVDVAIELSEKGYR